MRVPKDWNKQSEFYTCKHPSAPCFASKHGKPLSFDYMTKLLNILWCLSLKSSPLTTRHLTFSRKASSSTTVPQVLFGAQLQDQSWLCTMAGRRAPFQGPGKLNHTTCKCLSCSLLQSLRCSAAPALQVEPARLHFSAVQTEKGKLIKPLPEGRMHRKASETTGTEDSEAAAVSKTKTKQLPTVLCMNHIKVIIFFQQTNYPEKAHHPQNLFHQLSKRLACKLLEAQKLQTLGSLSSKACHLNLSHYMQAKLYLAEWESYKPPFPHQRVRTSRIASAFLLYWIHYIKPKAMSS